MFPTLFSVTLVFRCISLFEVNSMQTTQVTRDKYW